jgi:hypothetical protein
MDDIRRETIKSGLRTLLGEYDKEKARARLPELHEVLDELTVELGGLPPLGIKRFISFTGNLTAEDFEGDEDTDLLLDSAGRLLNKGAFDGIVTFEGDDGEVYVATHHVAISKATPEWAADALK